MLTGRVARCIVYDMTTSHRRHYSELVDRDRARNTQSAPRHSVGGSTITVTIGRNVGNAPLSIEQWDAFTARILQALADLTAPQYVFTYDGHGEWDGVGEDSRAIVAVNTATASDVLRSILHDIGNQFGQDAIGLAIGQSELV